MRICIKVPSSPADHLTEVKTHLKIIQPGSYIKFEILGKIFDALDLLWPNSVVRRVIVKIISFTQNVESFRGNMENKITTKFQQLRHTLGHQWIHLCLMTARSSCNQPWNHIEPAGSSFLWGSSFACFISHSTVLRFLLQLRWHH